MGKHSVAKRNKATVQQNRTLNQMQKDYNSLLAIRDAQWQQQIQDAITAIIPVCEESTFVQLIYLSLMVLHDKFGFGKQRLTKYVEEIMEIQDAFGKDYISIDDMVSEIKKVSGLDLLLKYEEQYKMWQDRCAEMDIRIALRNGENNG